MKNKNLIYIQYEIKDLLAWFKALLKLNNKNNYTDINIISEAFSIKLFEEFYNTKFKILKVGNPGFDIVSKDMKFYVQITSNHNFAVKANSMLKEFDSKPGRFNGCKLILFYLGGISSAKRRRFYEKNEHQEIMLFSLDEFCSEIIKISINPDKLTNTNGIFVLLKRFKDFFTNIEGRGMNIEYQKGTILNRLKIKSDRFVFIDFVRLFSLLGKSVLEEAKKNINAQIENKEKVLLKEYKSSNYPYCIVDPNIARLEITENSYELKYLKKSEKGDNLSINIEKYREAVDELKKLFVFEIYQRKVIFIDPFKLINTEKEQVIHLEKKIEKKILNKVANIN